MYPAKLDDTFGYQTEHRTPSGIIRVRTWNFNFNKIRSWISSLQPSSNNGGNPIQKGLGYFKSWIIPDRAIFWALLSIPKAWSLAKNGGTPFTIVTTSPLFSAHLIGMALSRIQKVRWIADVRDFYFLEHEEYESPGFFKWIKRRCEKAILKNADFCTFVSKSMLDKYRVRYPFIRDKSDVIYHGLNNKLPDTRGQDSFPVRIVFCGSFYQGLRNPWALLECLQRLAREGFNLHQLEILIIGSDEQYLMGNLDPNVADRVRWLGPKSQQETEDIYRTCDWGWLSIPAVPAHMYTIPVKFYDYLSAGLSLLAFVPEESEVFGTMEKYHVGLLLRPDTSEESISHNCKILKSALLNPSTCRISPKNYQSMTTVYGLEQQLERFEHFIRES